MLRRIGWKKAALGIALTGVLGTSAGLMAREGQQPPASDPPPPPSSESSPANDPLLAPYGTTWKNPRKSGEDNTPVLLVNSRRIRLNYEIREVGPSGVSSIELWATRDGKTWQRYSDEPPPKGPLVVAVAEEGRYGFTLVVKSGVGMNAPRPAPGDQPQVWVEVDETRPTVKLTDTIVGRGAEHGQLEIRWSASDSHLLPRPITLSTSVNKDGPWTTIAANLENTGRYTWKMPSDVPYKIYVRVEAADRAGNVGVDQLLKPVAVDHALPRGVILGVEAEKKDSGEIHH
jgi:hypothetical protein